MLSANECVGAQKFDDGIARGSWFMDIHCPAGLRSSKSWVCDQGCKMPVGCGVRKNQFDTLYPNLWLGNGTYYDIPYRCLTPKTVDNLWISGRCISADHGAMSSLRVIGTCFAIGEAVGVAAAMAMADDCKPTDLDGVAVRRRLTSMGIPL